MTQPLTAPGEFSPVASSVEPLIDCPVCRSGGTIDFFKADDVPCQDGIIWSTRQEAIDAARGDIRLAYCPECSHIFNRVFDPGRFVFDQSYDISLFHSPTYCDFIDRLIAGLVQRHGLRNKTVLEIACGKGDFLKRICLPYDNRGIGFDPTFVPDNFTEAERKAINVHRSYYGRDNNDQVADLVMFRSFLQYVRQPREWLETIRRSVARPSGVVFAEVPNSAHTFVDLCIWNIVYEHGCFYSEQSLARLFQECGYAVLNSFPCFVEDQNLGVEAMLPEGAIERPRYAIKRSKIDAFTTKIAQLPAEHASKVALWQERLGKIHKSGRRAILWGAGARAISFCNLFNITAERMPFVVDINPHRQGKFLPKTLQQVVAPEDLHTLQPSVIIITNSGYAREIEKQISDMNLTAEVFVM